MYAFLFVQIPIPQFTCQKNTYSNSVQRYGNISDTLFDQKSQVHR